MLYIMYNTKRKVSSW